MIRNGIHTFVPEDCHLNCCSCAGSRSHTCRAVSVVEQRPEEKLICNDIYGRNSILQVMSLTIKTLFLSAGRFYLPAVFYMAIIKIPFGFLKSVIKSYIIDKKDF